MGKIIQSRYYEIGNSRENGSRNKNKEVSAKITEMLNTLLVESKLLDQEFTLTRHEIKVVKNFLKFNFTSFIPSVNWTSSDMWDENNTTVEILKMVYGKLKNENANTFNESTKSL